MSLYLFASSMTEGELLKAVIELATALGWLCHHQRAGRTAGGNWSRTTEGQPGFPDLTLAHPTLGVRFVELKSAVGRLSPGQAVWREVLQGPAEDAYSWHCWRPEDWLSGRIEAVLRGAA